MKSFYSKDVYTLLPDSTSEIVDIRVLEHTDSTNTRLKQLARTGAKEGTVLIALEQSAGRGRLGRSFFSPGDTGLYISVLLKPKLCAQKAVNLTAMAAVAMAKAIENAFGKECGIKWVNDIFISGKKVCGILCESSFAQDGTCEYVVVGAGANICPPKFGFPENITGVAGAILSEYTEKDLRPKLAAEFTTSLFKEYAALGESAFLGDYRRLSTVIGKDITVVKNGTVTPAKALAIDDDCRLAVRYADGTEELLLSAEVSVRV